MRKDAAQFPTSRTPNDCADSDRREVGSLYWRTDLGAQIISVIVMRNDMSFTCLVSDGKFTRFSTLYLLKECWMKVA